MLKHGIDIILQKLPKAVVAENADCVAKKLTFKKVIKILKDAGCAVTWQVLNSNSWLLQHRARVYDRSNESDDDEGGGSSSGAEGEE